MSHAVTLFRTPPTGGQTQMYRLFRLITAENVDQPARPEPDRRFPVVSAKSIIQYLHDLDKEARRKSELVEHFDVNGPGAPIPGPLLVELVDNFLLREYDRYPLCVFLFGAPQSFSQAAALDGHYSDLLLLYQNTDRDQERGCGITHLVMRRPHSCHTLNRSDRLRDRVERIIELSDVPNVMRKKWLSRCDDLGHPAGKIIHDLDQNEHGPAARQAELELSPVCA